MHYEIIGFSAMVNNNITRTAKQHTATLVKISPNSWARIVAETIPCLSEGFSFLGNGGVFAGLMFNEAIYQEEQ